MESLFLEDDEFWDFIISRELNKEKLAQEQLLPESESGVIEKITQNNLSPDTSKTSPDSSNNSPDSSNKKTSSINIPNAKINKHQPIRDRYSPNAFEPQANRGLIRRTKTPIQKKSFQNKDKKKIKRFRKGSSTDQDLGDIEKVLDRLQSTFS